MKLFNQRKPKRFSYTPRHLKEQADEQRSFDPGWRPKHNGRRTAPTLVILLVILAMVVAAWYILNNYEN